MKKKKKPLFVLSHALGGAENLVKAKDSRCLACFEDFSVVLLNYGL